MDRVEKIRNYITVSDADERERSAGNCGREILQIPENVGEIR